jgi:hypothetical protein
MRGTTNLKNNYEVVDHRARENLCWTSYINETLYETRVHKSALLSQVNK